MSTDKICGANSKSVNLLKENCEMSNFIKTKYGLPVILAAPSGMKVTIKTGDITKEDVSVIVNSTHPDLQLNCGTLSSSILIAAGPGIQREALNSDVCPLEGDGSKIAVTSGGMMPCALVYHGSIPPYNDGAGLHALTTFVEECFQRANDGGMQSLALPPIGTGVLEFPKKSVIDIIMEAALAQSSVALKDVRLILPEHIPEIQQAAGEAVHRLTSMGSVNSYKTLSTSFTTKEGLLICMKKGRLENEEVDVIVNTTTEGWHYLHGTISKALIRAAGYCIKEEYGKKRKLEEHEPGTIVQTSGGSLKCRVIYHGCLSYCRFDDKNMCYRKLVDNILETAHKNHMSSLAIPAFGTGLMGYAPLDAAHMLFSGMAKFSSAFPQTTLKSISLVIYENDVKTYKEFQAYADKTVDEAKKTGLKRKSSVLSPSAIELPANWKRMGPDETVKVVQLSFTSDEYQKVKENFEITMPETFIISIERVQCASMHQLYSLRKIHMLNRPDNVQVVERILYHGTTHHAVDSINRNGFNRSYCGKNGVAFGKGVYFAKDASYSAKPVYSPPDSIGFSRVYQCKVLTGEYTLGVKGLLEPPSKKSCKHAHYDSVVDCVSFPGIFVVFADAQAYPEYIIRFQTLSDKDQ